ncbi:MFS transporter [Chloroflexota bacterium]
MRNDKWRTEIVQKLYRQRWRIWIVACAAHTIGMFHRAAMAPMADRLMADFDISAFAFGGLGAVYFYIYAAMQLPSGTLADTLGPRKTITTGLLLSSVGSLIMSMAPTFAILFLGRLIISFGVSIVWLNVIKLVMEWFQARQVATVTGISSSLMHLGQIAATTPLALLIIALGWRVSLVAIVGISVGLAIASWFIIRDNPAKIDLPPIAESSGQDILQSVVSDNLAGLSLVQRLKIILSNKYLWPLVLVSLGTYGAYATLFYNWTVIYLMQTYALPRDSAANFLLIATAGMMVGAPSVGFLSDRILRRRRLPIVLFTGLALLIFLLWTFWDGGKPPLEMLYPLCFLMGFSASSMFLPYACIRDIVPPFVQGMALGLINMGAFVGPALAQPLFGYILDLGWRGEIVGGVRVYPLEAFQQGLWICCFLAALGFIGALLVKETYYNRS